MIDPLGELVCVAVYKRGGREVMKSLAACALLRTAAAGTPAAAVKSLATLSYTSIS